MPEAQTPSLLGRFISALDDNHSRVYTTVALLFYFVPVVLISILFISATNNANTENTQFDTAFVALFWIVIVVLPLMLTFGVFIVYRATYTARNYAGTSIERSDETSETTYKNEEIEWDKVINKALDWSRFLMPLCLLNMFITLTGGFLLFLDLSWATDADLYLRNDIIFGYYDFTLFFGTTIIKIPGSVFYLGLLGFMVQFLEVTRRRYVSRNLVPRFYLMSSFRLLQVVITVVVVFVFQLLLFSEIENINGFDYITATDPALSLVTAFLVGMFPLQLLTSFTERIRERLGMSTGEKLPITLINGIDNTLESLLQEENVDSTHILATSDINEINRRTAIPVSALKSWQNQAKLLNLLGKENLIHRFARMGINDFDDLLVLAENMDEPHVDNTAFKNDFTRAMKIKSDDEAIGDDSFWRILMLVLIREYHAEYPEKRTALMEARKELRERAASTITVEQNAVPELYVPSEQDIMSAQNNNIEPYVSSEQGSMLEQDNNIEPYVSSEQGNLPDQNNITDMSHG